MVADPEAGRDASGEAKSWPDLDPELEAEVFPASPAVNKQTAGKRLGQAESGDGKRRRRGRQKPSPRS